MNPVVTGLGSVTPYGPLAGAIKASALEPQEMPRAYTVEPFRPTDVVPGLKTRRLDRLSVWSLVAASLAIRDAGVDLNLVDRSRAAVVFGTGLGCLELTEAHLRSAAENGWHQTDPIVFPETLGNAPASHVARVLDLRGPNITISSKGLAGEWALVQAASLLRHRQADLVVVMAGDTLTKISYEWYGAAGWLSRGFVPSEGVVAMVMESADLHESRGRRWYFSYHSGRVASGSYEAIAGETVIDATSGGPVAAGLPDTGALLRLNLALGRVKGPGPMLLSGAAHGSYATLQLELP